ncbi:MAG TPA: ADP-ribosylglycohydrolase family protein [Pirellulales bacterium]
MTPTREDRILGCLLGGALGDAAGGPFEGKTAPVEVRWPNALFLSDETQLTFATCEAIVASRSVLPAAIAERFAQWHRERRITGVGSSVLKALVELETGGHWATVGATGERAAGNGAAMRIAPLAFLLDPTNETDRVIIRDVCRITHRHDEAYVGALAIMRTIRSSLAGAPLHSNYIAFLITQLPDSRVRDRFHEVFRERCYKVAEYVQKFPPSGYVVDSVPLAILAAIEPGDLLTKFTRIAELGGDADTIASMTGQIVGALIGAKALPREILDRCEDLSEYRRTAADFAKTVAEISRG